MLFVGRMPVCSQLLIPENGADVRKMNNLRLSIENADNLRANSTKRARIPIPERNESSAGT